MLNIIENEVINIQKLESFLKEEKQYKFINCNFFECKINDLELENVIFENCNMEEITFLDTKISNCNFSKTNIQKAEFLGCSIDNCIFDTCNLANCNFSNSNKNLKLYWTKFKNCRMIGSNFYGIQSNKITFENCILRLSYFYGFNFKKQTITGLDLTEADICDCNFDEAILENSSFRNANFKGINSFYNTDLRDCDIGGIKSEKIMGSFISKTQATELLSKLSIKVI